MPVTWIWGPVASLNVASTITPALTAFTAFVVIRRWAPWTPAAFVGGLLYGFSPFVLSSLEFAHLMTAALMLLPLILAVLDEILIRQRHSPIWAGVLLGAPRVRAVLPLLRAAGHRRSSSIVICVVALVAAALVDRPGRAAAARPARRWRHWASGSAWRRSLLAWPVWFALEGPAHLSGLVWPNVGVIGGFIPLELRHDRVPAAAPSSSWPSAATRAPRWPRRPTWAGASWPSWWRAGGLLAGAPAVVLRLRCSPSASSARWASAAASGSRPGSSAGSRWSTT